MEVGGGGAEDKRRLPVTQTTELSYVSSMLTGLTRANTLGAVSDAEAEDLRVQTSLCCVR